MAVAVLSPQDCLRDPISSRGGLLSTPSRTKIHRNPNPTNSRHSRAQSIRRKRSPNSSPHPPHLPDASPSPQSASNSLMMAVVVKILKRGEEIPKEKNQDLVEIVSKKVSAKPSKVVEFNRSVDGFYAGSGFFTSTPPSSLPVPAFIKKSSNVEATTGLCRLLNLSL